MTAPASGKQEETTFSSDLFRAVRYYLRGRRGWHVLGGIVVTVGLAFNWGWLVTAGIAPILISVLPCVAMCAVGVCCMRKRAGTSAADTVPDQDPAEPGPSRED